MPLGLSDPLSVLNVTPPDENLTWIIHNFSKQVNSYSSLVLKRKGMHIGEAVSVSEFEIRHFFFALRKMLH